jgi:hypothetical protein
MPNVILWSVLACSGPAVADAPMSTAPTVEASAPAPAPAAPPPAPRTETARYDVWDVACPECELARPDQLAAITASSSLAPNGSQSFGPELALDDTSKTAWCEGVEGDGVGEWLEVRFAKPTQVAAWRVEPGSFASPRAARMLNRVAALDVTADTGEQVHAVFPDDHWDIHPTGATITPFEGFAEPVTTLRFQIAAAHSAGGRFAHTCMSRIELTVGVDGAAAGG